MKQFGLIGYPLGHSFSKKYFTEKFEREGISDCQYETYPIDSIERLPELIRSIPDLRGLNVTIPYKEKVIPYLADRSEVVKQTGACNCILVREGQLTGHNTDVIGFRQSLERSFPSLPATALVLGTGGAAKAVEYVLKQLKISFRYVSRKPSVNNLSYEQVSPSLLAQTHLLINTTPLGMQPHITEAPPIPYEAIGKDHCLFDLIYNPAETLFLRKGLAQGARVRNGLEMLVIQAEESWKIWNS